MYLQVTMTLTNSVKSSLSTSVCRMSNDQTVPQLLKQASDRSKVSSKVFTCTLFGNEWDNFVVTWAPKCYKFVQEALGPYAKEPLSDILAITDAQHSAGINAAFSPDNGQIWIHPSSLESRPGTILEKLTHELIHASLAAFPEGDSFSEEGAVDYSVWVLAHAPLWEPYRKEMVAAAAYNIECRKDRALKDISDYDRKRWAGGLFYSLAYGPWIIPLLKARKAEGKLIW